MASANIRIYEVLMNYRDTADMGNKKKNLTGCLVDQFYLIRCCQQRAPIKSDLQGKENNENI